MLRGGRLVDGQVELDPGGEIWLRVIGLVPEFTGTASVHLDRGIGRFPPTFRCGWLKDGRLELFTQKSLGENERTADFRGWTAEPGGWLVFTTDYQENGPPITVRFDRLTHQNWP